MAIKRRVQYRSFKGIELSAENVRLIFNRCLVSKDTPEERKKGDFDEDMLTQNRGNILYLLGQLPCVHQKAGEVPLDGNFIKDYLGYVWTNDGNDLLHLLNMGISAGYVSYRKDGEKDFVRMGANVEPTLSLKDPSFEAWFPTYDLVTQAKYAYDKEKYSDAFKLYLKAAEMGNAEAQQRLGIMYETGRGTEEDKLKALSWQLKAADQGNAAALYACGRYFEKGVGAQADEQKALSYYERAAASGDSSAKTRCDILHQLADARKGDANAQYKLAKMYDDQFGAYDKKAARMWFEKAAAQGHRNACVTCGFRYGFGTGVPEDKEIAAKYFQDAAKAGDSLSKRIIALMVKKGAFRTEIKDFDQVWNALITKYRDLSSDERNQLADNYMSLSNNAQFDLSDALGNLLKEEADTM